MKSSFEVFLDSPLPMRRELLRWFSREAPLTIFDIGSCEGEDTIRYSRLFPNARLFAVEPLPSNVDKVRANLGRFGVSRAQVVPLALSDTTGSATFHVSSGQPSPEISDWGMSSSLLAPTEENLKVWPWLKFSRTIEVPTDTLANLARREAVDEIDYVHMDVQGAELKVLEGAGDLIRRIKAIWLEVSTVEFYKGQPLKQDIERWLADRQFIKRCDTHAPQGDQFYINTRYFQKPMGFGIAPLVAFWQKVRHRMKGRR